MSALTTYSPDELNLYLLDFKSGTEFQVYANHKIPHIKVLALDAMQEFGQSVLDELIGMMQKRLDMFTEETQKGYPVKDITSYRKYTGKKMPRILVVADEFQVLFSEAHNRRVANTCATRLADIISLYRVCGIHFILATQTMSRLRNGFTVSPSTLSEMHVRIGLKCSESECNLLFGGTNAKAACLAVIYDDGIDVYRNPMQAAHWYREVLNHEPENTFCMYRLAVCLADPFEEFNLHPGYGMLEEAYFWACKGVEKGDLDCHMLVAWFYEMGNVVNQDYDMAYKYFRIAADNGHEMSAELIKRYRKNIFGNYYIPQ